MLWLEKLKFRKKSGITQIWAIIAGQLELEDKY
jgi:hypothetical protein